MKMIDAAIETGIRPIAIEPEVGKAFSATGGYELIKSGIEKLKSEQAQNAFADYTKEDGSPDSHERARMMLAENGLTPEWFQTVDQALQGGMKFDGLASLAQNNRAEFEAQFNDRLHDMRNATWANVVERTLGDDPNSRMLLFAGREHFQYGHT